MTWAAAALGAFLWAWPAARAQAQAVLPAPARPAPAQASAPQPWVAQASVIGYRGRVDIEPAGSSVSRGVDALPVPLAPGDKVRTSSGGEATLQFKDGSRVTLGNGSIFTVEEERPEQTGIHLLMGKIWCAVSKLDRRRFRVRTPTAVVAVRGTEFSVEAAGARTAVEVFGGLVSVRGQLGDEALVGASRRVDVVEGRMGAVQRFEARPDPRMPALAPAADGRRDEKGKDDREKGKEGDRRREGDDRRGPDDRRDGPRPPDDKSRFGFSPDRFKDFVTHQADEQVRRDLIESGAAVEQKAQMYQEGKTLIDAFGRRVRVEEYVKRPTPDSFKFVSFNFRDNRTDFASVEVTANRPLPERLADAGNLWFSPGSSPPSFFALKQKLTMSNGSDSVVELGVDGAPQAFTTAGAPIFDPNNNTFIGAPGGSFYRTMFGNKYEFINGNAAAISDVYSGSFRPADNGAVSGAGHTISGMMWRSQPVKVRITDGAAGNLGEYWTDSFVNTGGGYGLAYGRTAHQPGAGVAHFVSQRSYINYRDDSNGGGGNGILDFGEALDPMNAGYFHDVVERMNGTSLAAMPGAGARQATGDTLVFSDKLGTGNPAGNPQQAIAYPGAGSSPVQQALAFARDNPRDWLVADEYAVDDLGRLLPTGDSFTASASLFTGANFERRLRSSRFSGDIDVVMSPAFIFQSGVSEAAHQDRAIPSPGPKE